MMMMQQRTLLPALLRYLGICTVAFNARFLSRTHDWHPASGTLVVAGTRARDGPRPDDNNRSLQKNRPDSFSSCLLWMDDNFRLPEWLAYHYYVMNLRYLVIHPDPRSKGSPRPVLDQWRDRIHIVEWTDPSEFSETEYDRISVPIVESNNNTALEKSLLVQERTKQFFRRQIDFYHACGMHMKSQNRKWTSFHDSDEFMVVVSQTTNHSNANDSRGNHTAEGGVQDEGPGMALQVLQRYSHAGWNEREGSRPPEFARLYEAYEDWDFWFSALPCLVLPRVLMGSAPSTSNEDDDRRDLPAFLDADRFDTLRYRVQGTERGERGGPGKAIVDVSRLPDNAVQLAWGGSFPAGVHRPFGDLCTNAWAPSNGVPLAFHHYVGSWEAFSYRDDVRRGVERTFAKWKALSSMRDGGANDDATHGIPGFVRMVGEAAARELLQNAGLPRNYTKPTNDTSDWEAIA